ncbi:hypothetical protein [Streptomyces sp. JNUCC 63]
MAAAYGRPLFGIRGLRLEVTGARAESTYAGKRSAQVQDRIAPARQHLPRRRGT